MVERPTNEDLAILRELEALWTSVDDKRRQALGMSFYADHQCATAEDFEAAMDDAGRLRSEAAPVAEKLTRRIEELRGSAPRLLASWVEVHEAALAAELERVAGAVARGEKGPSHAADVRRQRAEWREVAEGARALPDTCWATLPPAVQESVDRRLRRDGWLRLECGGWVEVRGGEPVRLNDAKERCWDQGLGGHTCGPGCTDHVDHEILRAEVEALFACRLTVGPWVPPERNQEGDTAVYAECTVA
jgi:hypothetical protein